MTASMIRTAYHLTEAATAFTEAGRLLAVGRQHVADAAPHDPDPEVAGQIYDALGGNLPRLTGGALLAAKWCEGRVLAGWPDLDRERATIDAGREAS